MIPALLYQFSDICSKHTFLGLVPWYQYLDYGEISVSSGSSFCGVKDFVVLKAGESSDLPLILLAVVDDLIRIAGLIAVIFVIYGGIKYSVSQGNPDQTAQAQSTILNALVGLAVAITAVAFVSFVGNKLG